MQEETTQKTIDLAIKTSKLTASVLQKAMKMYLEHQKHKEPSHGKIPVKKLVGQGAGAKSIEVTDDNIKAFERVARKYNVDFAVKRDKTMEPPKYLVFFKGKDADVIAQAFKEFVKVNEKKQQRPSLRQKLKGLQKMIAQNKNRERSREKNKDKGTEPISKVIDGIVKDLQSIPKTVKEKCRGVNGKQLALKCAPYVIFGYVFNKVSWLYGQQAGDNTLQKMLDTINGMGGAFVNLFPSFMPRDLLVGVGCGIGFRMVVYYKVKNAKKSRQGVEYGSARWGTAKDIEPYVDPVFENNVLLTATERLMMSGRPKQPKYARNKNILVIGGSGSGKTCFFVKPNLMQMHSSYVVTDPKGTVLVECGRMLSKNDYQRKNRIFPC